MSFSVAVSSPSRARAAWLAWGLLAAALALFGLGTAITALTPTSRLTGRAPFWPVGVVNLSLLSYVAVGALVASHRPRNPVGWIFCAIGLAWEANGFAQAYATRLVLTAPASLGAASPWLVLPANMWTVGISLAPAILLYFPNGQLPSRRWRPLVWLLVLSVAALYLSAGTQFLAGPQFVQLPTTLELLGLPAASAAVNPLRDFGAVVMLLLYLAGVLAIGLRWRRARTDERQQLKWFALAAILLVAVLFVTTEFFDALQPLDPGALYASDFWFGLPFAAAVAALPVAAGVAILRYRLYDIDLIIRRTLVYGVLSALLALIYLGAVLVLQGVFTALTGAGQSELVTVLSTLAIAALFVPLRRRLQGFIDRRFYRRRYDATRTLAEFGATLRNDVNLEDLSERLLGVVDETMQPESVGLWLRAPERTVKP